MFHILLLSIWLTMNLTNKSSKYHIARNIILQMFYEKSVFQNIAKFIGINLCQNLVFKKITYWKLSWNLQESNCTAVSFLLRLYAKNIRKSFKKLTCVRALFLIKLHVGGTISTSNCWYTCTLLLRGL